MSLRAKLLFMWLFLLTLTSGYTNGSAILYYDTPITHHTGNLSQLAINFYPYANHKGLLMLSVILCFFIGATVAGILFHQRELYPKLRYGLVLLAAGLILLFVLKYAVSPTIHLCTIAIIIGMQNGMFIHYKGLLVRTSHMTGYLSDAGFNLGCFIRGKKADGRKFLFYTANILFFLIGSFIAVIISNYYHDYLLIISAMLYLLCGFYYFGIRHHYF